MKLSAFLLKTFVFVAVLGLASAAELPFNQFVVFGDSLSDTGNDLALTQPFGQPTPPSPPYDRGRFTDGPGSTPSSAVQGVWHEQLAAQLGIAPATATLVTGGNNYAFGGAITGGSTGLAAPDMQAQVGQFLTMTGNKAASDALYLFWGGANDLLNATTPDALNAATTKAIANISGEISALTAAGAKNFLWVNLPPLNDLPRTQGTPLQSQLALASLAFNTAQLSAIEQLQTQFAGVTITNVDAYALFLQIIANPSQFGFTNLTDPALGADVNPDNYLFWDAQHPTSVGHSLVANLADRDLTAAYGLSDVPEPLSSGLLFLGCAFLLWRLRFSDTWTKTRTNAST